MHHELINDWTKANMHVEKGRAHASIWVARESDTYVNGNCNNLLLTTYSRKALYFIVRR